jgi:hypothetical protein
VKHLLVASALAALGSLSLGACAEGNGDPIDLRPGQAASATDPADAAPADAIVVAPSDAGREATPVDAAPPGDAASTVTGADAAADASASCASYADPTATAVCHACGSKPCQPNGCYNGYWCETTGLKCVPKPAACP